MKQPESPRLWPLLLFVSSAIAFGIIAPFFGGMLAGALTGHPRSKTVEIVRYPPSGIAKRVVTVEGSTAPQPALSTAPAFTRQAESATPTSSSRRGAADP